MTLRSGAFNKRKYSRLSHNTSICWTLLLKTQRSIDPQESKGIPNSGYHIYIKVKKQRPIENKKNRKKHPLQPDYAKFIQYKVFCTAVDYKPLMTLSGIASVFPLFYTPEISIYFKYINTLFIISKKNIYFPVVFLSQITRCYQWNDCDEQHAFIIRDQINKTLLLQSRHLWHTKFTDCIQQPRPALVWKSPYKSSPKRKV